MNSKPEECLVKTAHNAMDVKTALSWSHMKVCPLPGLKNCKMVHKRHHDHSQVKLSIIGQSLAFQHTLPPKTLIAHGEIAFCSQGSITSREKRH